jgi:hypothetical protein
VRRVLRVAQECGRKTHAESASNGSGYGNSGGIQTIFDDLSSTAQGMFPYAGPDNRLVAIDLQPQLPVARALVPTAVDQPATGEAADRDAVPKSRKFMEDAFAAQVAAKPVAAAPERVAFGS